MKARMVGSSIVAQLVVTTAAVAGPKSTTEAERIAILGLG